MEIKIPLFILLHDIILIQELKFMMRLIQIFLNFVIHIEIVTLKNLAIVHTVSLFMGGITQSSTIALLGIT